MHACNAGSRTKTLGAEAPEMTMYDQREQLLQALCATAAACDGKKEGRERW